MTTALTSVCTPAAAAKRAASKAVSALDDLHSAVEATDAQNVPGREEMLAEIEHATRVILRARKALASAAEVKA